MTSELNSGNQIDPVHGDERSIRPFSAGPRVTANWFLTNPEGSSGGARAFMKISHNMPLVRYVDILHQGEGVNSNFRFIAMGIGLAYMQLDLATIGTPLKPPVIEEGTIGEVGEMINDEARDYNDAFEFMDGQRLFDIKAKRDARRQDMNPDLALAAELSLDRLAGYTDRSKQLVLQGVLLVDLFVKKQAEKDSRRVLQVQEQKSE